MADDSVDIELRGESSSLQAAARGGARAIDELRASADALDANLSRFEGNLQRSVSAFQNQTTAIRTMESAARSLASTLQQQSANSSSVPQTRVTTQQQPVGSTTTTPARSAVSFSGLDAIGRAIEEMQREVQDRAPQVGVGLVRAVNQGIVREGRNLTALRSLARGIGEEMNAEIAAAAPRMSVGLQRAAERGAARAAAPEPPPRVESGLVSASGVPLGTAATPLPRAFASPSDLSAMGRVVEAMQKDVESAAPRVSVALQQTVRKASEEAAKEAERSAPQVSVGLNRAINRGLERESAESKKAVEYVQNLFKDAEKATVAEAPRMDVGLQRAIERGTIREQAASMGGNRLGLNRIGQLELQAAGVNSFQALASGMNPLHVATMEGAQVAGSLVQGGFFSQGGTLPWTQLVAQMSTPIGMFVAGVTAATVALGAMSARLYLMNESVIGTQGSLALRGFGREEVATDASIRKERTELQSQFRFLSGTEATSVVSSLDRAAPELQEFRPRLERLPIGLATTENTSRSDAITTIGKAAEQGAGGLLKLTESLNVGDAVWREHIASIIASHDPDKIRAATNELITALEGRARPGFRASESDPTAWFPGLPKLGDVFRSQRPLQSFIDYTLYGTGPVNPTLATPRVDPQVAGGLATAVQLSPEVRQRTNLQAEYENLLKTDAKLTGAVLARPGGFVSTDAATTEDVNRLNRVDVGVRNVEAMDRPKGIEEQRADAATMARLQSRLAIAEQAAQHDVARAPEVREAVRAITEETTRQRAPAVELRPGSTRTISAAELEAQERERARNVQLERERVSVGLAESAVKRTRLGPANLGAQVEIARRDFEVVRANPAIPQTEGLAKQNELLAAERQFRLESESLNALSLQYGGIVADATGDLREQLRVRHEINAATQANPDISPVQKKTSEVETRRFEVQVDQRELGRDLMRSGIERASNRTDLSFQQASLRQDLARLLESERATTEQLLAKELEIVNADTARRQEAESLNVLSLQYNSVVADATADLQEQLRVHREINALVQASPDKTPVEKRTSEVETRRFEVQTEQRELGREMTRSGLNRALDPVNLTYQRVSLEQDLNRLVASGLSTEEQRLAKIGEIIQARRAERMEAENVGIAILRQNELLLQARGNLAGIVDLRRQEAATIEGSKDRSDLEKIAARTQLLQAQIQAQKEAQQLERQFVDSANRADERRARTATAAMSLGLATGDLRSWQTIPAEQATSRANTDRAAGRLQSLAADPNLAPAERARINDQLAELYEADAQKQLELQTKLTNAIHAENERRVENFKSFFKTVESGFGDLLATAIMDPSKTGQAFRSFIKDAGTSLIKNVVDMGSKAAGSALAPSLGVKLKEGEDSSISNVLAKGLGSALGLTVPEPKLDQAGVSDRMKQAGDAQLQAGNIMLEAARALRGESNKAPYSGGRGSETSTTTGVSPGASAPGPIGTRESATDYARRTGVSSVPVERAYETDNAIGEAPTVPSAPASGVHEAISRAEGTFKNGAIDYDAVYGNGKFGLPPKPLTEMSLAEVRDFGKEFGPRTGVNTSAMGAFQIQARSTMLDAARDLNMDLDTTKFTPDTQRQMADWVRQKQGFGAWEGFKAHPEQLAAAEASAPGTMSYAGATSEAGADLSRSSEELRGSGTELSSAGTTLREAGTALREAGTALQGTANRAAPGTSSSGGGTATGGGDSASTSSGVPGLTGGGPGSSGGVKSLDKDFDYDPAPGYSLTRGPASSVHNLRKAGLNVDENWLRQSYLNTADSFESADSKRGWADNFGLMLHGKGNEAAWEKDVAAEFRQRASEVPPQGTYDAQVAQQESAKLTASLSATSDAATSAGAEIQNFNTSVTTAGSSVQGLGQGATEAGQKFEQIDFGGGSDLGTTGTRATGGGSSGGGSSGGGSSDSGSSGGGSSDSGSFSSSFSSFGNLANVYTSAMAVMGQKPSPVVGQLMGGIGLIKSIFSLFTGGAGGGLLSMFGLEGGGVLPAAASGWVVPSAAGGTVLNAVRAPSGTWEVPSAAGGFQVQETSLSGSIRSGIRAMAAAGDVAGFGTARMVSSAGGHAPVADGKGGQLIVGHAGEMVVPAPETGAILRAIAAPKPTRLQSAAAGLVFPGGFGATMPSPASGLVFSGALAGDRGASVGGGSSVADRVSSKIEEVVGRGASDSNVFNFNIAALDGHSVHRMLMNHADSVAASYAKSRRGLNPNR